MHQFKSSRISWRESERLSGDEEEAEEDMTKPTPDSMRSTCGSVHGAE